MTINYASAPPQNDWGDLIPNGALAFARLKIRWFNADQGICITPSKNTESQYLDCELTIVPNPANGVVGPWNNRKVWTRIGVAGSQAYINMGSSAIKAILEVGRGAVPQNRNSYDLNDYSELDESLVAVKIKVQPAKDGYAEKNEIAAWLSPVSETKSLAEDFARLLAGDCQPKAKAGKSAESAQAAMPWAAQAAPATAITVTAPAAQPAASPAAAPSAAGWKVPATPAANSPAAGAKPAWLK